jgi:hypothetical protein
LCRPTLILQILAVFLVVFQNSLEVNAKAKSELRGKEDNETEHEGTVGTRAILRSDFYLKLMYLLF